MAEEPTTNEIYAVKSSQYEIEGEWRVLTWCRATAVTERRTPTGSNLKHVAARVDRLPWRGDPDNLATLPSSVPASPQTCAAAPNPASWKSSSGVCPIDCASSRGTSPHPNVLLTRSLAPGKAPPNLLEPFHPIHEEDSLAGLQQARRISPCHLG